MHVALISATLQSRKKELGCAVYWGGWVGGGVAGGCLAHCRNPYDGARLQPCACAVVMLLLCDGTCRTPLPPVAWCSWHVVGDGMGGGSSNPNLGLL